MPRRTAAERCRDNMRALEIAQRCAREGRPATEAERDELARYCGWGDTEVRRRVMPLGEPSDELLALLALPGDGDVPAGARASREAWERADAVKRSTLNAHYTSPELCAAVWAGLLHLGLGDLRAPRVLEPSAGVGRFLSAIPVDEADLAPERLTAVELDDASARILALVHPRATSIRGALERVAGGLAPVYDAVVGNVPFGDYPVSDGALPKSLREQVHDYFVCRAVSLLRPGGVAALITSAGTLDKPGAAVREWLRERAELLGAFRLPGDAHEGAGTAVTSDVLYLRRRGGGAPEVDPPGDEPPPWVAGRTEVEYPSGMSWGGAMRSAVSGHFGERPEAVLGEWCRDRLRFGRESAGVAPRPGWEGRAGELLRAAVLSMPAGALRPPPQDRAQAPRRASVDPRADLAPSGAREASLARLLRAVRRLAARGDAARPALAAAYAAHRAAWGSVRLDAELARHRESRWWPLVAALERPDGQPTTVPAVLPPPPRPTDARAAVAHLLDRQGWFTPEAVTAVLVPAAGDVADAVAASPPPPSLEQVRRELAGWAWQLGPDGRWVDRDEFLSGDVVGRLDEARAWAAADASFAGHVEALERAQPETVEVGGEGGAKVPFGAGWVPALVYLRFFAHVFPAYAGPEVRDGEVRGRGLDLSRAEATATWHLRCTSAHLDQSVENIRTMATKRMTALEIAQEGLNMRVPTVWDVDPMTERRVRNEPETAAAAARLAEIRDKWDAWIVADPERRAEIGALYNRTFNRVRERAWTADAGAFPGLSTEFRGRPFALRPHQASGALRMLSRGAPDDALLVTYLPGAGKTAAAVAGIAKRVQAGLCRKAVVVVPASTVSQWAEALRDLYPHEADGVLVGTDRAFGPANRRRFLAEAALGSPRVVLLTYEQFRAVPLRPETFTAYLSREVADLDASLGALDEGDPAHKPLERAFKARQKSLATFEARYRDKWVEVEKRGDADVCWEAWGCDLLVIDEVHLCKAIPFSSKMTDVSGLPRAESQRALDAMVKAHYLTAPELFPGLTGGGGAGAGGGTEGGAAPEPILGESRGRGKFIGLTGTPITNSVAEVHVMMRLFQPRLLRKIGLWHFDAWASAFTTQVECPEIDATGNWRVRRRLRFHNLRQLQDLLGLAWERVDPRLASGDRPDIVGGRMRVVETQGSDELAAYTLELAKRADLVRKRMVDPSDDNMLKITHDGRVASLCNGRPGDAWPEGRPTKVDALVREVWRLYCESDAGQGVQLVFCDLHVPTADSSAEARRGDDKVLLARAAKMRGLTEARGATGAEADTAARLAAEVEARARGAGAVDREADWEERGIYGVIRDRLVRAGILADEVAYASDADGDEERAALHARVRSGAVRVLIGSTQRLGVGVNVQERAYAAHHVTVPWRPDWLDQANKRVDRDGNTWDAVHLVCYPTTRSFDAVLWQFVEEKAGFIAALSSGTWAGQDADDIGEVTIDAATAKAIALNDQRVVEKVRLEIDLHGLARQHRAWTQSNARGIFELRELPRQIEEKLREAGEVRALVEHRNAHQIRDFTALLAPPAGALSGPPAWTACDRQTAEARLTALAESIPHGRLADGVLVGQYRGLSLVLLRDGRETVVEARHGDGACVTARLALRGAAFASIEAALASLETGLRRLDVQVEVLERRLAGLRAEQREWPRAAEARAKLARYDELCAAIATDGVVDRHRFKFD